MNTINQLTTSVTQKLKDGVRRFVILISSPGGQVVPGITGYNFLKGIPAEVVTHNYGSADSMGVILFCAGSKRYCTPDGRFLLHGIGVTVNQPTRFEEKQLDEMIKGMRIDRQNISKIIAENCKKTIAEIEQDLFEVKVLNPQEAKEYGLVHEIKTKLFPEGSEVINIA